MIYAQILAGGKGTRMGNVPMPKQFLPLADKPILIHTIEKFSLERRFDAIIVVCPLDWLTHTTELIEKYSHDDRVQVVAGGSDRNETLMKGIAFIHEHFGEHPDDVLITHDAVRPFVTQRIISDNIEAVLKNEAVDTVIPATDTIIQSHATKVDAIPVRSTMYQGQTPQSFKIATLVKAYASLTASQKGSLTDACKIMLLAGVPVSRVRGEAFNVKITTPYDLRIATALIEERS